jgi:hypothetical protein
MTALEAELEDLHRSLGAMLETRVRTGDALKVRLFCQETDRLVADTISSGISEQKVRRVVMELLGRLSILLSAAAKNAQEPEGERAATQLEATVSRLRESWGKV